jgi:hypothetical protein
MEQKTNYLRPTPTIDCDNATIREKALSLTSANKEMRDKARTLFYFVRDEIRYNLYVPSDRPEHYRASAILERKEGYCVQKAVLLAALSRAIGIPASIHMAAIRNYFLPAKVKDLLRGNFIPAHGYNELYIEGRWVKVTPVFNIKICQDNRFIPVDFDGLHDAMLPSHNLDGQSHIEYVRDLGCYEDLPFNKTITWRKEALGDDFFKRLDQAIIRKDS